MASRSGKTGARARLLDPQDSPAAQFGHDATMGSRSAAVRQRQGAGSERLPSTPGGVCHRRQLDGRLSAAAQ